MGLRVQHCLRNAWLQSWPWLTTGITFVACLKLGRVKVCKEDFLSGGGGGGGGGGGDGDGDGTGGVVIAVPLMIEFFINFVFS